MNDTVSGQVRDYVLQVRAALADLPAEDVEEFTTGMEADLSERLAEPGDGTLRDRLGEPEAYAAELRSAAGLPPRMAGTEARKTVAQRLSSWWSGVAASVLTSMPWLSDLRPVWWAVRGFALAALPALMIGVNIAWLGVLGAAVSVALGLLARNEKLTGGWVGPVRVIGNLVAVLLLPIAFVMLVDGNSRGNNDYYPDSQPVSGPGLSSNGEPVANLYAYDETGRRIDKVRLLDQNGRPLQVSEDFMYATDDVEALDRLRDPDTGQLTIARDIFPLRWDGRTGWERMGDTEWEPPMAITPLPGPVPSVEVSPSATVTTTATPGASVSPMATATPKVSPTSPGTGATATPTPTLTASPGASR